MASVARDRRDASAGAAVTAAGVAAEAAILTAHGQRHINRVWELTQAIIALAVVAVTLYCAAWYQEIPAELAGLAGSVISTYFTRTNHTAVGGVSGVGPVPLRVEGREQERRGE